MGSKKKKKKKELGHVRAEWILVLLHTVNKDKHFPHDA